MFDALRPFVSRIVGAGVGAIAGALTKATGIELDPAAQASLATTVTLIVYAVVHRFVDKKVNPADTAK